MNGFKQVWAVDFEFIAPPGECPDPVCMVAIEQRSGTRIRLWLDELRGLERPPFGTGSDTLLVAYFASAEIGCFLALNWPVPERILDLYVEFRQHTNGTWLPDGRSLLAALAYFNLARITAAEKDLGRQLVMRGGPWTSEARRTILEYCESDVEAVTKLLPAMSATIDLPRALLRGRYMSAVARMERIGVPIDENLHGELVANWSKIRSKLVAGIDRDYGVFDGLTFKHDRFAGYLERQRIPWPRLNEKLDLKSDTFRQMAKAYPQIAPLHELRHALSQLKLNDLQVGRDGRNRVMLSGFGAATGRNTPSNSRFIFGPSVWLRGLIRPAPGRALLYIDWSQQEFAIAAVLSVDANMLAAYESGDPYLAFAKQAGAVPADATKASHGPQRELYKTCALGVQFGMAAESLAMRIGRPEIEARNLLANHRRVFRKFWQWSDDAADHFNLRGELHTVFGWRLQNGLDKSDRTARNFPMQSNGAEMMRIAACLMTEAGLQVCAPVHDAFLIEAGIDELENVECEARAHMAAASRAVLSGFEIRSDVTVYEYPDRYSDPRGVRMFETVTQLLAELDSAPTHRQSRIRRASILRESA